MNKKNGKAENSAFPNPFRKIESEFNQKLIISQISFSRRQ